MGVYLWQDIQYPTESIVYKMKADSSWNLYIPLLWRTTSWNQSCSYNWQVSVDGGAETQYSGTWSSSNPQITLSWYVAWSNHTIMIRPTTENYLWARAYCWYWASFVANLTEIVYDWSWMGYATNASASWNYFRYYQYSWCTSITKPADEYMPDTVTGISNYFRQSQYDWCTSLLYACEEKLNDNITTIWTYFRQRQYAFCTSLTQIKWWKDLSVWSNYYRQAQFNGCTSNKTVKVLSNVWYPAYDANALVDTYVTSVSVPSAYLSNFVSSTSQPRTWITDSKFVWY